MIVAKASDILPNDMIASAEGSLLSRCFSQRHINHHDGVSS